MNNSCKCPICENPNYNYISYGEYGVGTVEQYGYCDRCGYLIEQAYSRPFECFLDNHKGFKLLDGKYIERNVRKHRKYRKKNKEKCAGIIIFRDSRYSPL